MSEPSEIKRGSPLKPHKPSFLALLDWLPWEKILIWLLVLLAVYALRDFFFIIFMTFILSYIMRSIVLRVTGVLSPNKVRIWLERTATLMCFVLLLFGVYVAGNYLGPRLVKQAEQLLSRVGDIDPNTDLKSVLTKSLGPILFSRDYGDEESDEYQTAFQEFQAKRHPLMAEYQDFGGTADEVVREFDTPLEREELAKWRERLGEDGLTKSFERWFRETRAPQVYRQDPEPWRRDWREFFRSTSELLNLPPLEEFEKQENFEVERDQQIYRMITREYPKRFPDQWSQERLTFENDLGKEKLALIKLSPDYRERFREHYDRLRDQEPERVPYEYETFVALREAYLRGETVFAERLEELGMGPKSEEERLEKAKVSFRAAKEAELTEEFMSGGPWPRVISAGNDVIESALQKVPSIMGGGLKYIRFPAELALSLLLSLFITFDIRRLRNGIKALERSRVRGFYHEVAPGLANFGRLIGRAFQAQGVIAIFNTILTFTAIKLLGVQNEVFLCVIVFACSFIPVLGVVLSSVPIAIMALVQPGGNVWLAIEIVLAILLIHFIETSVLNPKILGDMLHLHPVMVLAVLAVGEHFFGVWGLLLGVPVTVYIIRCVILADGIPGLIEPNVRPAEAASAGRGSTPSSSAASAASAAKGPTSPSEGGGSRPDGPAIAVVTGAGGTPESAPRG